MKSPIRSTYWQRVVSILVLVTFIVTGFNMPLAQAQEFTLPKPGVMVHLSPEFNPPILKGLKVYPDNPFKFDFVLDKGDSSLTDQAVKDESTRLIKYFLASLTIPEKDLWVNLSPYEKDRIVPESFGQTEMGRDLLAEDYMLKQITASLIYPEDEIGKKFWKRVYEEAQKKYGTTQVPVNTFNKVWIVPEKAVVYENAKAGTAYVVESRLKVMLEQDYLALEKNAATGIPAQAVIRDNNDVNAIGSQIVREIVIPELTKEINEGKNFIQLRQVYQSLILATWYKKKIKDSILHQVYVDKNKTSGVDIYASLNKQTNKQTNPSLSLSGLQEQSGSSIIDPQLIYQRYLQAFKKGVYNYIKEEQDPLTQQVTPRKYFSGGMLISPNITEINDLSAAMASYKAKSEMVVTVNAAMLNEEGHGGVIRKDLSAEQAQTKKILIQLFKKPKNHHWLEDKKLIEGLIGKSLGQTKRGMVNLTIESGYFYQMPLAGGKKYTDYDVTVSAVNVLDNLVELTFRFDKENELSFERTFQMGQYTQNIPYHGKGEIKPPLETLYLDSRLGLQGIGDLVKRSSDYNWLLHQDELPNLVGMNIGETAVHGILSFTPIEGFPFNWLALGAMEVGWKGKIIDQSAFSNHFNFTVNFTKEGEKSFSKTYQIGRIKRPLKAVKDPQRTQDVLEINDQLGLLFLKEMVQKEAGQFKSLAYNLEGLRLGASEDRGKYYFTIDGFRYDWFGVGLPKGGDGWEGVILSSFNYDSYAEFKVAFKKNSHTIIRTFQVTANKRRVKDYRRPELGEREFLNIVSVGETRLLREDLLKQAQLLIADNKPGKLLHLLKRQVNINLFQGLSRYKLFKIEASQKSMTPEIFDSIVSNLSDAYEKDGRLSKDEIKDLMERAFEGQIREVNAQRNVVKLKQANKKKNEERPALTNDERLRNDLSLEMSIPEEEVQEYWRRGQLEELYYGLAYIIEDEIIKLGDLYSRVLFNSSISAGGVVLKEVISAYNPQENGDSLINYLRRQLKVRIPEVVKEDNKLVAGKSLNAPIGEEEGSYALEDTIASEPPRFMVESFADLKGRFALVDQVIQHQASRLNGHIVHMDQKLATARDIGVGLAGGQVFQTLNNQGCDYGVYLAGKWGRMAFTKSNDPLVAVVAVDKPHEELTKLTIDLSAQLNGTLINNNGSKEFQYNNRGRQVRVAVVSTISPNEQEMEPLMEVFANAVVVRESRDGVTDAMAQKIFDEGDEVAERVIGFYETFLEEQREVLEAFDFDKAQISSPTQVDVLSLNKKDVDMAMAHEIVENSNAKLHSQIHQLLATAEENMDGWHKLSEPIELGVEFIDLTTGKFKRLFSFEDGVSPGPERVATGLGKKLQSVRVVAVQLKGKVIVGMEFKGSKDGIELPEAIKWGIDEQGYRGNLSNSEYQVQKLYADIRRISGGKDGFYNLESSPIVFHPDLWRAKQGTFQAIFRFEDGYQPGSELGMGLFQEMDSVEIIGVKVEHGKFSGMDLKGSKGNANALARWGSDGKGYHGNLSSVGYYLEKLYERIKLFGVGKAGWFDLEKPEVLNGTVWDAERGRFERSFAFDNGYQPGTKAIGLFLNMDFVRIVSVKFEKGNIIGIRFRGYLGSKIKDSIWIKKDNIWMHEEDGGIEQQLKVEQVIDVPQVKPSAVTITSLSSQEEILPQEQLEGIRGRLAEVFGPKNVSPRTVVGLNNVLGVVGLNSGQFNHSSIFPNNQDMTGQVMGIGSNLTDVVAVVQKRDGVVYQINLIGYSYGVQVGRSVFNLQGDQWVMVKSTVNNEKTIGAKALGAFERVLTMTNVTRWEDVAGQWADLEGYELGETKGGGYTFNVAKYPVKWFPLGAKYGDGWQGKIIKATAIGEKLELEVSFTKEGEREERRTVRLCHGITKEIVMNDAPENRRDFLHPYLAEQESKIEQKVLVEGKIGGEELIRQVDHWISTYQYGLALRLLRVQAGLADVTSMYRYEREEYVLNEETNLRITNELTKPLQDNKGIKPAQVQAWLCRIMLGLNRKLNPMTSGLNYSRLLAQRYPAYQQHLPEGVLIEEINARLLDKQRISALVLLNQKAQMPVDEERTERALAYIDGSILRLLRVQLGLSAEDLGLIPKRLLLIEQGGALPIHQEFELLQKVLKEKSAKNEQISVDFIGRVMGQIFTQRPAPVTAQEIRLKVEEALASKRPGMALRILRQAVGIAGFDFLPRGYLQMLERNSIRLISEHGAIIKALVEAHQSMGLLNEAEIRFFVGKALSERVKLMVEDTSYDAQAIWLRDTQRMVELDNDQMIEALKEGRQVDVIESLLPVLNKWILGHISHPEFRQYCIEIGSNIIIGIVENWHEGQGHIKEYVEQVLDSQLTSATRKFSKSVAASSLNVPLYDGDDQQSVMDSIKGNDSIEFSDGDLTDYIDRAADHMATLQEGKEELIGIDEKRKMAKDLGVWFTDKNVQEGIKQLGVPSVAIYMVDDMGRLGHAVRGHDPMHLLVIANGADVDKEDRLYTYLSGVMGEQIVKRIGNNGDTRLLIGSNGHFHMAKKVGNGFIEILDRHKVGQELKGYAQIQILDVHDMVNNGHDEGVLIKAMGGQLVFESAPGINGMIQKELMGQRKYSMPEVFDWMVGWLEGQRIKYEELVKEEGDLEVSKAQVSRTGGIDLTSDKVLQVQNNAGEIKFNIDPAMLQKLQNAQGFTPVIINVQPLKDLQLFLGIN